MKVVAFNCSSRMDGNTSIMIDTVLKEISDSGIETKQIQLAGSQISTCSACYKCFENKDQKCVIAGEMINDCIREMIESDGIIIGSPVYFSNITPTAASLICRAGMVARANGMVLAKKVGAAVVSQRRAGAMHAFSSINHFFTIQEMIIVGANYWNVGFGKNKGDVFSDQEGLDIMRKLGQNMSWLLKKIYGENKK